jgi:hypothetical protein
MLSLLVFNRVYRLDTVSHIGIFDPSCELAPLYSYNLLTGSPPPPPTTPSCVNKYGGVYLYSV